MESQFRLSAGWIKVAPAIGLDVLPSIGLIKIPLAGLDPVIHVLKQL